MRKVFTLAPDEEWIVDRFVKEFNEDNADIAVADPRRADVVWLMADWSWERVPGSFLSTKKVLTTIHHIVPEKFGLSQLRDFQARDHYTMAYHVPNVHTEKFIRPLTDKPIHIIPYWANQKIWCKTGENKEFRKEYGLPQNAYLIGSFQRDTEGNDLVTPKLEKGPDLLADAIISYRDICDKQFPVEVVLAGWRRQYIMKRLDAAGVKYHYFERPPQNVVNELYQTLDLYPVTARQEGGPQSLIEAGLHGIKCVSRDIGIASSVLSPAAINDNVVLATPEVPNIEALKLPNGYAPFRKLIEEI